MRGKLNESDVIAVNGVDVLLQQPDPNKSVEKPGSFFHLFRTVASRSELGGVLPKFGTSAVRSVQLVHSVH